MITTIYARAGYKCGVLLLAVAALSLAGCTQANHHPKNKEVDDLLEGISEQSPNAELMRYAGQIKNAIEREINDLDVWKGKSCDLAIKLNPDGSLNDVQAVNGDPGFCPVAKSAIEHAKLPAPPSTEVYERIKAATLVFKI
jgi:colicin import membrane protein